MSFFPRTEERTLHLALRRFRFEGAEAVYRDARKRNGEGDVSFEALARQVKDSLPRLAEKYPGQSVSLDVTVKDGRTVLRPVVRGPRK